MNRKHFWTFATVAAAVFFVYFIGICVKNAVPSVRAQVDLSARLKLQEKDTADGSQELAEILGVRESRAEERESIRISSVEESLSIAVSIEQSIADSIEESIEESFWQSWEASSSESARQSSLNEARSSLSAEERQQESRMMADREIKEMVHSSIVESVEESIQASIEESIQASIAASVAASRAEASRRAAEEAARAEASRRAAEEASRAAAAAAASRAAAAAAAAAANQSGPSTADGPVVFIGDSRTSGFYHYGYMPKRQCYYVGGAVYAHYDIVREAAAVHPSKVVFMGGQNDLGVYHGDASRFIAEYTKLINYFHSLSPSTKIYVIVLIPDTPAAIAAMPGRENYGAYNNAILNMCRANGWTCIDTSAGFNSSYYTADGIHFTTAWYPIWMQNIRSQVGF